MVAADLHGRHMGQQTGSRAFHNERLRKQQRKVNAAFTQALALHQRGLIPDAQRLYRDIVDKFPTHFDSLHHLGISESQSRRHDEAVRLLDEALSVEPRSAPAHSNRGIALHELKRFDEAVASFDRAIAIRPDYADAYSNRGNALTELGRFDEAVASYDRAVALKPAYADAHSNRGNALKELRRFDAAAESCDRALALKPDHADALTNRGFALIELKRPDEALANFDKAIAINPRLAAAWLGRGNVLNDANRVDDAFAAYNQALAIRPDYFKAYIQLAACHGKRGDIDAVISSYDKALAIRPDFADAISNRIFALDFVPTIGFAEHQAARKQWWERVGAKIAAGSRRAHRNSPDPARRIVLGYVSSDFNNHSASTAFKPVLLHHDKTRFAVTCYACSTAEDDVTRDLRRAADTWHDASQWSDERLADQIQADAVDILVDLSGHSAGNRLGVFARKPAPVQVTAWGHATGTGLATMDYLFSDPVAAPANVRHFFAEQIYDLPCLITMEPPFSGFSPAAAPVLSTGTVTFGVFNRINKISDDAVTAWAAILRSVPGSRLLIKNHALDDVSLCLLLRARFAAHDIPADRIELRGATTRLEHLLAYQDVDICLDPFPQNGGVSTWEALHMGVPVVAKLGNSIPSRLSGAILSSIGMGEWVADSIENYRAIALKFAAMPQALQDLRVGLPAKIAASASGNNASYTKAVEAAYRTMWSDYVARAIADRDPSS